MYSVLMPVWSQEKLPFLEKSIQSMLNQTLIPYEFVFVFDEAISHEMDSLIKSLILPHAKIQYVEAYHLQGCGLGALLNLGVQKCSCPFIARMDSDDISSPNRCEKEFHILNSLPTLAVVGAFLTEFREDPHLSESLRKVPEQGIQLEHFAKFRNPMNHPTVMFRKSIVLEVGNYNPSFSHCEDYELWYRIIKSGYSIYNIQESLLHFRTGNTFLTRRSQTKNIKSYVKLKKIMKSDGYIKFYEYYLSISIQFIFMFAPKSIKKIIYNQLRTNFYE